MAWWPEHSTHRYSWDHGKKKWRIGKEPNPVTCTLKSSILIRFCRALVFIPLLKNYRICSEEQKGSCWMLWQGESWCLTEYILADRLEWKQVCPKGCRPSARGYHTLTTIGTYVILFGGKGEAGIVPSEKNLRYGHVCRKFGWLLLNS
jgi:hypothetical protein